MPDEAIKTTEEANPHTNPANVSVYIDLIDGVFDGCETCGF